MVRSHQCLEDSRVEQRKREPLIEDIWHQRTLKQESTYQFAVKFEYSLAMDYGCLSVLINDFHEGY